LRERFSERKSSYKKSLPQASYQTGALDGLTILMRQTIERGFAELCQNWLHGDEFRELPTPSPLRQPF